MSEKEFVQKLDSLFRELIGPHIGKGITRSGKTIPAFQYDHNKLVIIEHPHMLITPFMTKGDPVPLFGLFLTLISNNASKEKFWSLINEIDNILKTTFKQKIESHSAHVESISMCNTFPIEVFGRKEYGMQFRIAFTYQPSLFPHHLGAAQLAMLFKNALPSE